MPEGHLLFVMIMIMMIHIILQSPTITKRFAPNDVMNYGDNVDKISVMELKHSKDFLEVYVVEVFHPNFFWIQLRENKKCLQRLMDELT